MKHLKIFDDQKFVRAINIGDVNDIIRLADDSIINKLILNLTTIGPVAKRYYTPLIYAIKGRCNINVLECLIDMGADVNVLDSNQCAPIYHAIKTDQVDIVELLISKGVDIYSENVLNNAAYYNSIKVATLLLYKGVDVSLKNVHGSIAIKWACNKNHIKFVKLLLIQPGTTVEHISIGLAVTHDIDVELKTLLNHFKEILETSEELDIEDRKALLNMI